MTKHYHPPAFCPTHGVFPARVLRFPKGTKNIGLINLATNCPKCGGNSEIIPGVYDATQQGLNVLLDRSISPDALAEINRLAHRVQSGEITPQQAKKEAETISPKAAKLFDVANWSDQAKATLYAAIIGAATIVIAARLSSSPNSIVNVQPVIERVIEIEKSDRKNHLLTSASKRAPEPPLPKKKPKPTP